MLYINKNGMPLKMKTEVSRIKSSDAWKKIKHEDTDAVRACFESLPKKEIRSSLIQEQKGLCAYCMRKLINDGKHTSIEHWFPLSKDSELALSYGNMMGVCDGGRAWKGSGRRILSCDANKSDEEAITINPYNRYHMSKIAYKSDGTIYTEPFDKALEDDINNTLALNGKLDSQGRMVSDTTTELVRGRRDAFRSCKQFFRSLDKAGKCTSSMIEKRISEIKNAEYMPEYAGVILFVLEKKRNQLKSRGL